MRLKLAFVAAGLLALAGLCSDEALAVTKATDKSRHLDPETVIQVSRDAIGRKVGDHGFVDIKGAKFSLGDLAGKPVIVNLVYSSCSTVCPITTQHLRVAVEEAQKLFGPDRFAVLTIGFDARNDNPTRMAQFALDQDIDLDNWRIASADAATLDTLLGELGFSYAAAAGGFDHIAQTTILDADGVVYRHVYGDDFPIQMMMEPLKEAIYGWERPLTVTSLLDRFRYFCTTFDPNSGHYTTR
ncbi:MAG: SCO family protein [Hyphomicrobiales bacterium]|nr:SCO family protein [Hyphomicrobiales bacterium]